MPQKEKSNALLVVFDDANRFGELTAFLERSFGTIHTRNTFVSSLQYLMVQEPDIMLIDAAIENGRGLELCLAVRGDSSYGNVPLMLISEDDPTCKTEIVAFQAGVDDFARFPAVNDVVAARIRRLVKHDLKDALGASLSVEVGAKELPGILQYLETELKTGKLNIVSQDVTAVLCLREGRLTGAYVNDLEGPEVVTEVLCWPMTKVTFVEEELTEADIQFETQITGILMNSSVEVDEYNEIKKNLPGDQVTFYAGEAHLPADAPDEQKQIYFAALQDYSVDELIQGISQSERKATLWLAQLLEEGYLIQGDAAFENYSDECFHFYQRNRVEERLHGLRNELAQMTTPVMENIAVSGMGAANWMSPVPRIVFVGDNAQHMALFRESIDLIYRNITHKRMPTKMLTRTTERIRFDFGGKAAIDFVIMPAISDENFDHDFDEGLEDAVAIVHIASAQDRDTCRLAKRIHKRLRRRMRGLYLHVVPRVRNQDGGFLFKINCNHCGFKLAVDMEEAGYGGECPVCSKPLAIPESVDHLSSVLQLHEDMPIATIEPVPAQSRDLLLLLFDSILNFCTKDNSSFTDRVQTEVRGRIGKHAEKTQISIAETQFINIAEVLQQETQKLKPDDAMELAYTEEREEEEEDPSAFAPIPQTAAPEDDDYDAREPQKNEIEEMLSLLNKGADGGGAQTLIASDSPQPEEEEDDDLDGLLNSLHTDE